MQMRITWRSDLQLMLQTAANSLRVGHSWLASLDTVTGTCMAVWIPSCMAKSRLEKNRRTVKDKFKYFLKILWMIILVSILHNFLFFSFHIFWRDFSWKKISQKDSWWVLEKFQIINKSQFMKGTKKKDNCIIYRNLQWTLIIIVYYRRNLIKLNYSIIIIVSNAPLILTSFFLPLYP